MQWITALPMYNVTPALAADWRALLTDVKARVTDWLDERADTLDIVDPGGDLTTFWQRDDLLLSQTCGYPLVHALEGRVQLVATPNFDVPGCANGSYRSVIVAGKHTQATTLADCRGLRAIYNSDDSNSGMNLLRHAVAPLAREGRFFASVERSGGHLASLQALATDRSADVAAIDCVTFAYVREHVPDLAEGVREIGVTASSPALPFIASKRVPRDGIERLAAALADSVRDHPALAQRLRLDGFVRPTRADYAPILDLERDAIAQGYPRLA
ncbi:PhnD/SsuA/transferrin family substrate-binding protein [Caballeronia sp. LZ001]|uniref:phosphate/phosphite/phosphonate ABC transporter substrate-binding protein n=1 Tax=Caballeronia sp. LZ001 TaxID=3038553 RepID=UPI00286201BA|nr:PhnD/SsuA/transferrin family substrate-binding protein [Caballeronia sp. LZ001]MDR5802092.1 PhnD/SsuA/transferrin family substrate-binding protein [Caballeronia sp. LZ001]